MIWYICVKTACYLVLYYSITAICIMQAIFISYVGIFANGLRTFMKTHGYKNIEEMRGIAQVKKPGPRSDEKGHFQDLKDMILKDKPIIANLNHR